MVTSKLAPFRHRCCLYLAAAVSDFWLPPDKMNEHKIQSADGGLCIQLDQVPKLLGKITAEWAPNAYVVSFKLETDRDILIKKAAGAIDNYSVSLVCANILQSRREMCFLVEPTASFFSSSASSSPFAFAGDVTDTDTNTDTNTVSAATAATAATAAAAAAAAGSAPSTLVHGDINVCVSSKGNQLSVETIRRSSDHDALELLLIPAITKRHELFVRSRQS